jgi:hypothetical protein
VTIAAPSPGATTDAGTATLSGTAFDGAGPVDLRVGGKPVSVGDDGGWTATVPLREGENTIEAVVQSPFGPRDAASVTITRTPPSTTTPTPTPPAFETTPPPPPKPPVAQPPSTEQRLLSRLAVPKRARLAKARTRGIALTFTLGAARTRMTAELRGQWGRFARLVDIRTRSGRVVLRLKPSRRASAKAAKALRRRKAVVLRLKLTARSGSGRVHTATKKIRLVR